MMELLTLIEAARWIRLSPHTLRAWVFQRRIPVVRLGRRVLFRREDVETLVEKSLVEAKDPDRR
jgi:excisionase family DNA binding protein